MAREAEKKLINAELRVASAEREYVEAEKDYSASKQHRRNSQGRLVRSSLAVQEELAEEKDRLLGEVHMEKQALREAQKEVAELDQVISGQRETGQGEVNWSGNGEDDVYTDDDNNDEFAETMSYVSKRGKNDNLNHTSKKAETSQDRASASEEVGRRILEGWQLLDTPCPVCMSPLMSESAGSPEVCVFCDPEGDLELGEDDDFRDDSSRGSVGSVSITLDVPDDFDASDPEAMAKLVRSATRGMTTRKSRSRGRPSPRRDDPDPVGLPRSRSRQRSNGTNGVRMMSSRNRLPPAASRVKSQQQSPYLPPRPQYKSTPPRLTPESRLSPSNPARSRSQSRSKSRSRSRSLSRTRPSGPVLPSSHVEVPVIDDDDTSFLTEDKSTASTALGAIMNQIETCQDQLNEPLDTTDAESFREGMNSRKHAAALIEKLSAAANAVRNIEDM